MATEQEIKDWFKTVQVGDTFIWDKKDGTTFICTCIPVREGTLNSSKYKAFDFGVNANRYWLAGPNSFTTYLENIILDPTFNFSQKTNPVIRKTKLLELRFKNGTFTKTKMKPLPFPKETLT